MQHDVICALGSPSAMQNAFDAFVSYAIDFVCDAFSALIAQPLQAICNRIQSWAMGLISLIDSAALSIQGGASSASASQSIFQHIIDSDIFKLLTVVGLSLMAVITAASFLGPCGFLASMVAPFLVELLISGMAAAAFSMVGAIDVMGWISGTIGNILGDQLVAGMAGIMGATMGTIGWLASMMSSPVIGDVMGFALSSLGALLSWVGAIVTDWTQSLMLDLIGFGLAAWGVYEIFIDSDSLMQKLNPTAKGIMKGIVAMEAGIAMFGLTTTVASHE